MPLALLVPDLVKIGDTGQNDTNFDVAPDGKHIAALMPVEAQTPYGQKTKTTVGIVR